MELIRKKMATEIKYIFNNSDMHSSIKIRNVVKIKVLKQGATTKGQVPTIANKECTTLVPAGAIQTNDADK